MFLALVVALQRNLRRMQCVLAGAPRTEEEITRREQRHAMANAISLRGSLRLSMLWSISCCSKSQFSPSETAGIPSSATFSPI